MIVLLSIVWKIFVATIVKFGFTGFKNGFTACAGIAYIKNSFPFHYGAELSEGLCKEAKKVAKNINKSEPPSCLYFYKVQSSYTTSNYSDLIAKELTIILKRENDAKKDKELRIDAGPYFIHDQPGEKTTDFIAEKVEKLKDPKAPASPIRNWLSVLHKNPHQADFLLERINYNGFSKKKKPIYSKGSNSMLQVPSRRQSKNLFLFLR